MLTAEEKAKWIAELRDPNNQQTRTTMSDDKGHMCALGVLKYKVFYVRDQDSKHRRFETLYWEMPGRRWADQVLVLNDSEKKSFPEIADWIESNVETVS